MKDSTRRAIAYIAGRLVTNNAVPFVYDYQDKKHYNFRGNINGLEVVAYDDTLQCHIQGKSENGTLNLFHHGNNKHVTLTMKHGDKFEGFDHDSEKHYSGSVRNQSISIFDYQDEKYYNYSVQNT